LERQLIIHPKWGCYNIFCSCESSRGPHAELLWVAYGPGPYVVQACFTEAHVLENFLQMKLFS